MRLRYPSPYNKDLQERDTSGGSPPPPPPPPGPLEVALSLDKTVVAQGTGLTPTVTSSGGTPPYLNSYYIYLTDRNDPFAFDGGSSNPLSSTAQMDTLGTYHVIATVLDDHEGSAESEVQDIEVVAVPVVTSASIDSGGTNLTFVFNRTVTGHSGLQLLNAGATNVIGAYSSGDGTDTLVFGIGETVNPGAVYTWKYVPGDIAGNYTDATPLAAVSTPQSVTNNVPDTTAPTITAASMNAAGTTLTVTLSEVVTGTFSGFGLPVNFVGVNLNYVSGSGTNTYTFSTDQVYIGDTVSLNVSSSLLQDAAANRVADATGISVTNNSTFAIPTLVSVSTDTTGNYVDFTFNRAITNTGASVAHRLNGNWTGQSFTYQSGNGTTVLRYLSPYRVLDTDNVEFSYNSSWVDSNGRNVPGIGQQAITNISTYETTVPTFSNGVVAVDGSTVTLNFSEAVTASASLTVGGKTANYASGSGTTAIVYTTSGYILSGETVTTDLTSSGIQDINANNVSLSGNPFSLTNNSTKARPTITSSTVNAAGDKLTLVFSQAMNGGSNSGLSLSGTAATVSTYTWTDSTHLELALTTALVQGSETVTLSYSPGNFTDTDSIDLASFSGASVTNGSQLPIPVATAASYGAGQIVLTISSAATGTTGFVANVNGSPVTINSSGYLGQNIYLNIDGLSGGETVTVDYTPGDVVGQYGAPMAAFTGLFVTGV